MTIQYAILGFLSWQPLTGYDLKKMFAESETFHWSGNNNQIYRTLVDLHKAGLLTREVEYQEKAPARKIYAITEDGRARLREWLVSTPELPQFRHPLSTQLAWAAELPPETLDSLLAEYAEEVRTHLLMSRERAARQGEAPRRSARETLLWDRIHENRALFYQQELDWVQKLRQDLKKVEKSGKEHHSLPKKPYQAG
jgi:DNA-binding PadR family transcriptional regulator